MSTIDRKDELLPKFHFGISKTPSWLTHGKGHASIDVTAHREAGWLQFISAEYNNEARGRGGGRGKRTIITMDRADGLVLYQFLKELYQT